MTEDRYRGDRYETCNPAWHVEDSPWKADQVLAMLRKNRLEPRSICDVGCGAGRVLELLRQRLGPDCLCEGWDLSPAAIRRAKDIETKGLRFREGDLLASPPSSFELVMALDVVEHVENYMEFLRALRPRGRYHLFHVPLDLCAIAALKPDHLLQGRRSVGHLHHFCRETFLAALDDTGYEIVDDSFTRAIFQAPITSWRSWFGRSYRALLWKLSPNLLARGPGGLSLMVLTTARASLPTITP